MAYLKTNWRDGVTPVNAENLNKIENAVESLDIQVGRFSRVATSGSYNDLNNKPIMLEINDTTASTTNVYSSAKVDQLISINMRTGNTGSLIAQYYTNYVKPDAGVNVITIGISQYSIGDVLDVYMNGIFLYPNVHYSINGGLIGLLGFTTDGTDEFYFRVMKTTQTGGNSGGTTTDTTPPNDITNLTSSNITTSSVVLNWAASSSSDISSYDIYSGSTRIAQGVTTTTYTVLGLNANTSYTFYVRSRDTSNNVTSIGTSITITTLVSTDTTPPNDITNLTASAIGQTSLTLNWTASTSTDIAGYNIYNGGNTTAINTSIINNTNYNLTGLTANTSYSFRVTARDTSNNESTGVTVNVTTATSGTSTVLDNVSNITATNVYQTRLRLDWTAPSSSSALTYDVYANGTQVAWGTSNTYANISKLIGNTSYIFKIVAKTNTLTSSGASITVSTLAYNPFFTVTATPSAGTFQTSQTITLSASQTPCTIYYSLDGSYPDFTKTPYSQPITISQNTYLRYYADMGSGGAYTESSQPQGGVYTINNGVSNTVIASDTFDKADNSTTLGNTTTGSLTWKYFLPSASPSAWGTQGGVAYLSANGSTGGPNVAYLESGICNGKITVNLSNITNNPWIVFRVKDVSALVAIRVKSNGYTLSYREWGSFVDIQTYNCTPLNNDKISVTFLGDKINVYLNDVAIIQNATCTKFMTETKHGFGIELAYQNGGRFDNFTIEQISNS